MAKWQFTKSGSPTADAIFDDGILILPGDDGFTAASAQAAIPSDADGFNYVGTSD